MNLTPYESALGAQPFFKKLHAPVVQIGKLIITRQQLIEQYAIGNLNAATMLSKTLKRLRIDSIDKLASLDPADLYRVHGCGHCQVFVAMVLLDHHGYDVAQWWGWQTKGATVLRAARAKKRRGAQDTPTPRRVTVTEAHATH